MATVIPPIPLKKEFIDPVARFQSLKNSNIGGVFVISPPVKWYILSDKTRKIFDWYFSPNNDTSNLIVAAVSMNTAYELGDNLIQYFNETELFNMKKGKHMSISEFYQKNYPLVLAKAKELMNSEPGSGMSERFYINEVLYKMPEIKRIKPMKISIALAIYRYFESKIVLDMNFEFGGRMIAAAAADVTVYHALNPKGLLYAKDIEKFLNRQNYYIANEDIDFYTPDAIQNEGYDTVFTNFSFYEEDEINKKKYTDQNDWLKKYAYKFIDACEKALVKGGYLLLYFPDNKYTIYMEPVHAYCTKNKKMHYLGVIGSTKEDLDFASAIFVWRK